MKRALTITMTLALFGSLLFMGFAGSAAASSYDKHDKDDGDNTAIVYQDSHAETNQYQKVDQQNNLKQGDNYASAYYGTANAGNFAAQSNANAQTAFTTSANFADVNQW